MEKEVVTEDKNHEFYVPERLKKLHRARDYGHMQMQMVIYLLGFYLIMTLLEVIQEVL